MRRVWIGLSLSFFAACAIAARDWQAWCGYEDCPSGDSWFGLIVWALFLVAGLIGAAREGWRTFSLVVVWLLLLGLALYGWLAWNWHWSPALLLFTVPWWWSSAKKLFRPQRDQGAP